MLAYLLFKDHLKELQSKHDLDKGSGRTKSPSNISKGDQDTNSAYMNSNTSSLKNSDQANFSERERVGEDKDVSCHDNPGPATVPLAINDPTQYAIDLTPPAPNRKDTCNKEEKCQQKRRRSSGSVCPKGLSSSISVENRLATSKRMKVKSNLLTYGMLSNQEYYQMYVIIDFY